MQILRMVLKIIGFPFKCVAYFLIYIYKMCLSPLLPKSCIYNPSCSTFMVHAIREYGLVRGIFLGTKRLLSCHPKNQGGYEPIKINIKGDNRWLI